MAFFSNSTTCVGKNTTVAGCLTKINFFDRAYLLSQQGGIDCAGNRTMSFLREYAIYDTIICGENEDPNMWGIVDQVFGKSEMAVSSTSVWRNTWCRPDYSFPIKNGVTGGVGQPVVIELAQSAYSLDGTAAVPVTGSPINLPGLNYPIAQIAAINRDVPFGWTITLKPMKKTQAIILKPNQRLFPQPGARLVKAGSCPVDETSAPLPGKQQRTQMVAIRADWCIERELNEGYDGVLVFAPAPVIGMDGVPQTIDCWDALAAQMKRRAMKITRDQLLLLGRFMDNPDLQVDVQGYEGFEGYIPSVLNGGGIDYVFDPFIGFNIFQGMRAFSRFADANQRCREYVWFVSPEFRRGLTDSMFETIKNIGLGLCVEKAFDTTGGGTDQIIQYLGFQRYLIDDITADIKVLPYLASNTSYGIAGYAFNNMAMVMPKCPIRTQSGKTVSPIELFYPETECASGGYYETMVDERKTTRCMKVSGFMIQKFAAMFHCVEDHAIIRASVC